MEGRSLCFFARIASVSCKAPNYSRSSSIHRNAPTRRSVASCRNTPFSWDSGAVIGSCSMAYCGSRACCPPLDLRAKTSDFANTSIHHDKVPNNKRQSIIFCTQNDMDLPRIDPAVFQFEQGSRWLSIAFLRCNMISSK